VEVKTVLAAALFAGITAQAAGIGANIGNRAAALAYRDDHDGEVTKTQKFLSRAYTEPFLKKNYDNYWYFERKRGVNDRNDERFITTLTHALKNHEHVDVFILAHDNDIVNWLDLLPANLKRGLRFVYNSGCANGDQGPVWIKHGAKAYIGHADMSFSPFFYFYFLPEWSSGRPLSEAAANAMRKAVKTIKSAAVKPFLRKYLRSHASSFEEMLKGTDTLSAGDMSIHLAPEPPAPTAELRAFSPSEDGFAFVCDGAESFYCATAMRKLYTNAVFGPDRERADRSTYSTLFKHLMRPRGTLNKPEPRTLMIPGYKNASELLRDEKMKTLLMQAVKEGYRAPSLVSRALHYFYADCGSVQRSARVSYELVSSGTPVVWELMNKPSETINVLVIGARLLPNGNTAFDVMDGANPDSWEIVYRKNDCRMDGTKLKVL